MANSILSFQIILRSVRATTCQTILIVVTVNLMKLKWPAAAISNRVQVEEIWEMEAFLSQLLSLRNILHPRRVTSMKYLSLKEDSKNLVWVTTKTATLPSSNTPLNLNTKGARNSDWLRMKMNLSTFKMIFKRMWWEIPKASIYSPTTIMAFISPLLFKLYWINDSK